MMIGFARLGIAHTLTINRRELCDTYTASLAQLLLTHAQLDWYNA